MERAVEVFAIVNFLVIGLSHVVRHREWAEFFMHLSTWGRSGTFAHGFLTLFSGSLIVAFHNVWQGIPALLTVLGWLFVAKSVFVFLLPGAALRSMQQLNLETSRRVVGPGYVMIAVALVLAGNLFYGGNGVGARADGPVDAAPSVMPLQGA